jgi:hypothetical protein
MSARIELQVHIAGELSSGLSGVKAVQSVLKEHWTDMDYEDHSSFEGETSRPLHLFSGAKSTGVDVEVIMERIAQALVPIIGDYQVTFGVYYLDEVPNETFTYQSGRKHCGPI